MEGTTTPGLHSDTDFLCCDDGLPVHENIVDVRAVLSYLMVRDAHTRPGYVKLQVIWDGIPQTIYNYGIHDEDHDLDRNGRNCVKHLIMKGSFERNGPADTSFHDPLPSRDNVLAYRCSSIPIFAYDWIKHQRVFNWPSRHMLESMTSSGCFVVGVGHPASDEKHIEWRLSFSLQERDMMLSFNSTQHKCYILLKMVKNDIIRRNIGKCISSYHMKTCMFYLIQNTRPEIWIPENLFQCLRLCLNIILKWVNCGDCPNFFIKEENMFDRDVHRQVKQQLSCLLDSLIQAGPRMLLLIDCDNMNQYLIHPELLPASKAGVKKLRDTLYVGSYTNESLFRRALLLCCLKIRNGEPIYSFLKKQLQFVHNSSTLNRKPDNHSRQALSRIEKYIHSILGSINMSLVFNVEELDIKRGFLNKAENHFKQGRHCDMSSSRLMYASVLFTTGQYDRCVRLLEEIDDDIGHTVISSCSCHHVEYEGDETQFPSSYMNTASCVVFLPSNRNITPAPLLPEMYRSVDTPTRSRDEEKDFWFDCAVVDGKVYLHFLKYLAYTKLDQHVHTQVAIDTMKRLIDHELNLGHRETTYNLLGWIYVQENKIIRGIQYFIESWRRRPIHNAAKWHLGIAVYKHIIQNETQ